MANHRSILSGALFTVAFLLSQPSCADSRSRPDDVRVPVRTSLDGIALRNGDLIFQTTPGFAGEVLKEGLNSRWTHVGVAMLIAKRWFAIEAADSVTYTPLDQFIARGRSGEFVVARVRSDLVDLSLPANAKLLRQSLNRYVARKYDVYFQWNDERIYCSELVWKAFRQAFGIELSGMRKFGDFRLDGPLLSALIEEYQRTTGKQVNLLEPVVDPVTLLTSSALELL